MKNFDQVLSPDDDEQQHGRGVIIPFRVSSAEARILNDRCQGVDRSKYIRAVLFNLPRPRPRPMIPQVNRDTFIALSRIGTNLNQQTKAINEALSMGLNPALGSTYLKTLSSLQKLVQQVQQEIAYQNNRGEED